MTDPNPTSPSTADAVSTAEVHHVIVRACTQCGAPRSTGPCTGCGNTTPAVVHDLGITAAVYRNPLRQAWWRLVRKPLADRRIQRAALRAHQLRAQRSDDR